MQSRRPKILWALLSCALASVAVTLAADRDPADGVAFFEKHIRPVLAERCYSCHSMRSGKRKGGLQLDSRDGWVTGGDQGPTVIPGDVDGSLLIRAVRYSDPDLKMPPDKALPSDAIARLEEWVRMGAPDPRDKATTDPISRGNPSDPIAGREHWAFRPLAARQPRVSKLIDWPRSTIDSFVLERLEGANLQPAPDADPRVLVRRLYFQLTGLPPSWQQLASFVEDTRPDAYERLVDQLLDSPQFGERWGRHWLDLARYADSNGLDENFLFREAWRYRNWVINAVNGDVPYDRFLQEQIAGDLLPHDSIERRDRQRIAAGFLVIGPKVLLGNKDKNQQMEIADEQLDTIGRAILGQTLGCARCHDHKFDPVPTADYYALAGILTSTEVMERRYMLNEQRDMERLVGLGPDGESSDAAYEKYWREQSKMKEKQKHAKAALALLEKGDAKGLEEHAQKHADSLAEEAADIRKSKESRIEAQKVLLASLESVLGKPPAIPPRAMIPADRDAPADESIRLSGQFDRMGEQVPRGFLRVISDAPSKISPGQSGRLELGHWLTDTNGGAGQLAARVLANRIWYHLIGRGLVRTVDNFGRTGETPSHPELLDYLASELIRSDWSVKDLVRKIVLSRTFGISSQHDDAGHSRDPENSLLWRAHRRRLDPESLRDAMLLAGGELDSKPMDSSVSYLGDQATAVGDNKIRRRTDFPCRSVYLPVIRNDLPEVFNVFDFANPHSTTGMRSDTLVAPQGLFLLNDDSVMAAADATARRLLASVNTEMPLSPASPPPGEGAMESQTVDKMFELLFNARPTPDDRDEMLAFVTTMKKRLTDKGEKDAQLRAWSMACHALFASSRFQILD